MILFGSLFVLVGPLALHVSYLLPAVKPRTIPLDEFSEERARDYYPNLTDHGPRVSGTHADYMARAFLVSEINRLRSIADPSIRVALSLQDFNTSEVGTLQNIAVRISNVDSPVNSPCIMLVAHYDSGQSDTNVRSIKIDDEALFFQLNSVSVEVMTVQA